MSKQSESAATPVDTPIAGHLAVIHVTGDDAADFLQAQFCNDLSAVSEVQAQLSGYCNPKGRLFATFYVVQLGEGRNEFLLVLSADVAEALCKRLQMFVLRAAVKFELSMPSSNAGVSPSAVWQCSGRLIPQLAAERPESGSEPADGDALWRPLGVTSEAYCVEVDLPVDNPGQRRVLRITRASVDASVASDAASDAASGHESTRAEWYLQDIRAGIPWVTQAVSESLVPQMLNMQLVDGLSFKKGCYPGQEIVARMQYLGKLKRRMYRLKVVPADSSVPVGLMQTGDAVQMGENAGVGEVIMLAAVPERPNASSAGNEYEALIVLRVDAVPDADSWHIAECKIGEVAVALSALPLPYSFESAEVSS